ncbi:MAG TPA: YdbH domain-containing protein, partial [Sphingomicrobium sp.]
MRRYRGRKAFMAFGIGLLILLLVAVAALWIARRPIATSFLAGEFDRRGVEATYRLDRVGLRTQQVSNLVIGNPRRPDLTARFAQIQTRIKWNGSVEVYRVVARGVRLRGRIVNNKVSWGQIDKLMPPPTGKPFALPDFVLDVADSTISLATPFGPIGLALQGTGNLSGGFKGKVAAASPRLIPGLCQIQNLRANLAVEVEARRPHVAGPLQVARLVCPKSRFEIIEPRFDIDSRFNESFTRYDGRGRMAIRTLVAAENGLSAFTGELSFRGDPSATYGAVKLSARQSRLATIFAERTRLAGRYRLGVTGGTFVMVGDYAANSATLDPAMMAGITGPLAAAATTPIGPVATSIGDAVRRTVANFNATGEFRMVNFPGGGAARIGTAQVVGPNGARVAIGGGDGVTYYWPAGRIRVDGQVATGGGGLPTGRIAINHPRNGAPMSGVAQFAPYAAKGSRLQLAPIRFAAGRGGSTQVSTLAQVDGAFPDGRVRGLRLPITATLAANGGFTLGRGCAVVSVEYLKFRVLELGRTRLPICADGQPSIIAQSPGGPLQVGARINGLNLAGRLGETPLRVSADWARINDGRRFTAADFAMRMGNPDAPIIFDAGTLQGTFEGSGVTGTFADAEALVGRVPVQMSDAQGRWRFYKGDLKVDGGVTVADRAAEPRFYPLRSENFNFTLSGDDIRAGGSLLHPGSKTLVTEVSIRHQLDSGVGGAILDVPGINFGEALQPEELTRLSEGVIALVQGPVTGQGRINWTGSGYVTSTGEFSTANMDLAAPFGPVTGLTTTIRFSDLLGLETEPGQTAAIGAINPGILVENGVLTYQLLPDQKIRIQRGEWPFMGGQLILQETVLNFSRPSAKRLTFQLVGFDAKAFIDNLGFAGIEITGTFDGVLPMIFDEQGGRLVGARLDSRLPGGEFRYLGTKPKAGMMAGVAFDLLSNIRYRSMIIRLDGDLAGEFATRFAISEVSLSNKGGFVAGLVRGAFRKLPLRVNLSVRGP